MINLKHIIKTAIIVFLLAPASQLQAQSNEPTTRIGLYSFMTSIEGTSQLGPVSSVIDVPFKTILENLDFTFMGFVDHRRGNWSFIGDIFYADISGSGIVTSPPAAPVTANVSVTQTMSEAFVGYKVYEQPHNGGSLDVDVLGGVRYNKIKIGLGAAGQRSDSWVDGVIGVRAAYDFGNGWGASGWLDVGKGDNSDSYQMLATANYKFDNNITVYGGYRLYHFEYTTNGGVAPFTIDADYSGPMLGVSFQF